MKKAGQAAPNLRLSHAREERNWTQQEVADLIGTTPVNVSRWERGLTSPGVYFRHKLCSLFGMTAQELGLIQSAVHQPATDQQPHASAAPLWNVPYRRNPLFTGREAILQQLHDALTSHQQRPAAFTQPLALSGLGGIGKTQTAVEYAYRYRDDYQAVLWARAEARDVLISDIVSLASLIGLPEQRQADQQRIVAAVKRWLTERTGWLLILDNVEDPELIEEFLPPAGANHILLTTRIQALGTTARCIELERMEPDEALLFLLRRAKLIDIAAPLDSVSYAVWSKAKTLAEALEGLPLALDQAGAYIEETACGLAGYLDRYQTRHADLLRRRGGLRSDHPQSVTTSWSLSFEKLAQADPAAAELLRLCAFLHPDAIPEAIITSGAPALGPILGPVAADPLKLDHAVQHLRWYSLMRRDPNDGSLNLHRLIQIVLKDQMNAETQRQWAQRAVCAVSCAFPEAEYENWTRCQFLLPQAQACAALIEQWQLHSQEAVCLLQRLGSYLRDRGRYREAEPLLKRAMDISEQTLGAEHPDVAESLTRLAMLYRVQGRYEQAEPLYQRALVIRERAFGSEHSAVATSLNNLALLYWNRGKYEQAEPLYWRALAIQEQLLGEHHREVARILRHLAILYIFQGRYMQAEPLLQRALTIWEQALSPDHPDLASALHDLGFLSYTLGRYEQAESLFLHAFAIRERALGPEHDSLAYTLDNLALVYTARGKFEQAEACFRRALAMRERILGPNHHYVAQTLTHMGMLYRDQGRYTEAEPLLMRSLALRQQALGNEHPDVAFSLHVLADIYLAQQKYALAEAFCQRALSLRQCHLHPDHAELATSLTTLAKIYCAQGKYSEAEPLFIQALHIREQALGASHPYTIETRRLYAALLRQTKREAEAALLEEGVSR